MAEDFNAFHRQYESLRGVEHDKNILIEVRAFFVPYMILGRIRSISHKNSQNLLSRLGKLGEDFLQEKLDHARESQFNRDVQRRELQLTDELRKYKEITVRCSCHCIQSSIFNLKVFWLNIRQERDPFILVLIDGDGMIFDDYLMAKGETGGKEAAAALWAAIREYISQTVPELSPDYKIVTRIYANLKGLGEVCHRVGILENPALIEQFARGFTGSKQLFDFIDVGIGKDRADDKIAGMSYLNMLLSGMVLTPRRGI